MTKHKKYLQRCLELAKKGEGKVLPNPMVGAVIVKNGEILAEGYHKKIGWMHAEVEAINRALRKYSSRKLSGATLYVNLEPCCHYGHNPPCTDIISNYKFKEVVYCMRDPNPQVAGKGKKALEEFSIKVTEGILKEEAKKLNQAYVKFITKKIPYVIIKTALSLDGKITHPKKKYISNKDALNYVHELRNSADAILVGHKTNQKDKPRLTCRIKGGTDPKKVVLPKKNINVNKLVKDLGKQNIASLLVEGGSQVITSFLKAKVVDKIILLYTPEFFGSKQLSFCGELSKLVKLKDIKTKKIGDNIIVEGYL